MKRVAVLLLSLLFLVGCKAAPANAFENSYFIAVLPEPFEQVLNTSAICFAPYGDPLLSSSITFCSTELNWYFDSYTAEEYENALVSLCGYESLTDVEVTACRIDGYDARRIACKVQIEQGTHDLIIYAISADRTYFMILLNREGDGYIDEFDSMMNGFRLKVNP